MKVWPNHDHAPGVKLSGNPVTVGAPAPKPGKDIPGVLEELGMATELERLISERVNSG
jgi:crotonobetainyl-CoA:carnitine CoA-transferase CaiB-like acyl-CoA transferase